MMENQSVLRLDIGSGGPGEDGRIGVDQFAPNADVQAPMENLPYDDDSVDEIYSSHALEHIPKHRVTITLREWYRVLRVGGILILRVPDLEYCCREWLKNPSDVEFGLDRIFGNQEHEGQFHKTGFTHQTIYNYLVQVGFSIMKLHFIWSHQQQTIEVIARKGA